MGNQYDISSNHYPPPLKIIHRKKKKKHQNVPNHINIHYKSNRPKINIHNNSLNQQYGSSITSPTTQFTVRSPPTIHHVQTPPKAPKTAKSISYHSSHPTSPNVDNLRQRIYLHSNDTDHLLEDSESTSATVHSITIGKEQQISSPSTDRTESSVTSTSSSTLIDDDDDDINDHQHIEMMDIAEIVMNQKHEEYVRK